MTEIQVVLFDLGGVVVRLAPVSELLADDSGATAEDFWPRWLASPTVRSFERGCMAVDEFGRRLVDEMGLSLTPAALIERFARFPSGLYPGAAELVGSVRNEIVVGVLSNTNALHWETQADAAEVKELFDRQYLSFRMGLLKPDRELFEHVAADLGVDADRILFIDDNQINVDGARAADWFAEVAKGPDQAAKVLYAYGVA